MGRSFVIESEDLPKVFGSYGLKNGVKLPQGNTKPVKLMTAPERAVFYHQEALRNLALANYWAEQAEEQEHT